MEKRYSVRDLLDINNRDFLLNKRAVKKKVVQEKKATPKILKKIEKSRRIRLGYRDYIKSGFWSERKKRFFEKFGKKCFICNDTKNINVHHIVYGNYGIEKDEHLITLCRFHHRSFHEQNATKGNMMKETLQFIEDEYNPFTFL